ncbi:hypothetical protein MUP05_03610 [Candidatus Bathyarchaeota archaeon]|nr:hypothetical protein [Candidatus Bathyarchaeota archaeon]
MPFKDLTSFKIDEDCVRQWAEDLNPSTAKSYVYYFLAYLDWVKSRKHWQSAKAMLDDYDKLDEKERFSHLDILKQYVKSKKTGTSDRWNTWCSVRSFYEYHRLPLPRPSRSEASRIFKPSETDKRRALELAPLMLDEVRELIMNMRQPYRAAFAVMFQGAMGLAEFSQFNENAWHKVVEDLDKPNPTRVDLYRSKTSRTDVRKYYTFISNDAKTLIKQWLQVRPEAQYPKHLFLTFNKNTRKWVPITSPRIGSAITKAAKRTGLIKENGLGRYHIHAHEVRDLFKSLCTLSGVNHVASELFLGHTLDKLGYDKSPEYDEEWFRNEYRKVEPQLNVLSNPKGLKGDQDLRLAFKRELLHVAGYTNKEVDAMNLAESSDEDLNAKIREKLIGVMVNNGAKQKVVAVKEVEKHLAQGWEYVATLPNGKAILKLPS